MELDEEIEPIVETSTSIEPSVLDTENSWEKFGLDDRLMKGIYHQGWKVPSLVQSSAIPLALKGKDILAKAKTGSGKTAAYSIPIVQTILQEKEREVSEFVVYG
jgi:ATP-dependent RNA helicase DDX56/DBP9